MFARTLHPGRLLRSLYGDPSFVTFCRERSIPFDQSPPLPDLQRWAAALASLPPEAQARIELELAQVNELAGRDRIAHLLEAAEEGQVPPVSVPAGAPLALWYLVHHPSYFQDVFFQHEVREAEAWRTGTAALGLPAQEIAGRAGALGAALQAFFRRHAGTGHFCAVEAHAVDGTVCFVARIADRIQLIEGFSESGTPALQRIRPALTVLFVYDPREGSVLLKSHLRARERIHALFQCFGQAVLGVSVEPRAAAFDLEKLKHPFHVLPDGREIAAVRVKALHLRYPARLGRRQVKLETLASDEPTAVEQLLRDHVSSDIAEELTVCHAELQVRLRAAGRSKSYLIRLWPDRSNLNSSPLGQRLQQSLRRWGLSHDL